MDLNTRVFVALVFMVGAVFVCAASMVYSSKGFDGYVSLRGRQNEFTVVEAFCIGGVAVVLAAIVGWASVRRGRSRGRSTQGREGLNPNA